LKSRLNLAIPVPTHAALDESDPHSTMVGVDLGAHEVLGLTPQFAKCKEGVVEGSGKTLRVSNLHQGRIVRYADPRPR
jgi:hypothetical protein